MENIMVTSIFDLPPTECDRMDFVLNDVKVGLKQSGESLYTIFPFKLYAFQYEAIHSLLQGKDCFLTVGTDSGKSEAFLFPIFERILNGSLVTAIIIYPTKQLAEDQEKRIQKYCNAIMKGTGKKITYSRYNGDLSQEELKNIEKNKPNIIIATIDKLFYRFFKEENESFIDWLLQAGILVIDEVHSGCGGYLAHVKEIISIFKKMNPSVSVVLASATVKEQEIFRDKVLPSAQIYRGKSRRGTIRVMILQPEAVESFILEKLNPYLKKIHGVALVFIDSIQKVGEVVAKCNEKLMSKTSIERDYLLANSPFVCINSQLTSEEKSTILEKIHNGVIRFVFTTSVLELGMDIQNIVHIINIGWPITGKNGLLQRMGRLRFSDTTKKKNFTLILDHQKPIEKYYLTHPRKVEEILVENEAERILFDSKAIQRTKAFVLLRVTMGLTCIGEIISLRGDAEEHRIVQTAITLLLAQGLLTTKNHQLPYHERTLTIGDRIKVREFIRKHRIRSIETKWEVVVVEKEQERKIGAIDERKIIAGALPGNLVVYGSRGEQARVRMLAQEKIYVERLKDYQTTIKQNTLKPPLFIIEGQARVQQFKHMIIRYGRMIIRWETSEIVRYSREGKLVQDEKGTLRKGENNQATVTVEEELNMKENYQWDEKTSGLLIEFIGEMKRYSKEQKKQAMKFFKELLKKCIEIELHLSGGSFRFYNNDQENKIVLTEKGETTGNTEQVFTKFTRVKVLMNEVIEGIIEGVNKESFMQPFMEGLSQEAREITRKMLEGE